MQQLDPTIRTAVHLRTEGTSLVLLMGADRMPTVLHWGAELSVSLSDLASLPTATLPPVDISGPDRGHQPEIVPLMSSGWMGRPGLIGHRTDGTAWSPHFETTTVIVTAPVEAHNKTELGTCTMVCGPGRVDVSLTDRQTLLSLTLHIELLSVGIVRTSASVTNMGADDYLLEDLSLVMPVPLSATEMLDFTGRWGRERSPQRSPITAGTHMREGRHGRPGFDSPSMMFCGQPGFGFASGRVHGVHVAHSGNYRTWIQRTNDGVQVLGGGELLLPGEITLGAGDTYHSPDVFFQTAEGLDSAAQSLHQWERSLLSHPNSPRPVTLNVWEAVYFDHDCKTLIALADRAADVGVERFVLDDGWFLGRRNDHAGLGDWIVDPQVWPEGLHPLVNHVISRGMQFGLWVEPEMVNLNSELARTHPDWILRARAEYPLEIRHQQVVDLTNPAAWEYVCGRIDALLSEYAISYLKWDHNRDLIDAGSPSSSGRAAVHAQTAALYRLMDQLHELHPSVEIESCASGGGRIDLEMVRHAQRFWISDCIDPVERQSIMRWTSQLLAPELMGTHIASAHSHTTGRVSPLSFRAGTALWGSMGFELDLLTLSNTELEELRDWVSYYRTHRELLHTGRTIRRDVADGSIWLHGVVGRDSTEALYELTTRFRSPMSPRGRFCLPGLAHDRGYHVRTRVIGSAPEGLRLPPWAQNPLVLSGEALEEVGLHTPLLFPDQCLLIEAIAAE